MIKAVIKENGAQPEMNTRTTNPAQKRTARSSSKLEKAASSANPYLSDLRPSALVQRYHKTQEADYYKAEKRGFAPGFDLEDWLKAGAEVDAASRPLQFY